MPSEPTAAQGRGVRESGSGSGRTEEPRGSETAQARVRPVPHQSPAAQPRGWTLAAQGHIEDLMRGWRGHAELSRRRFMEVERAEALELLAALETVRGDVYLWRLGEIDAEKAMEGVRDAVGF